jgi:hypothetical protein
MGCQGEHSKTSQEDQLQQVLLHSHHTNPTELLSCCNKGIRADNTYTICRRTDIHHGNRSHMPTIETLGRCNLFCNTTTPLHVVADTPTSNQTLGMLQVSTNSTHHLAMQDLA